MWGSNPQPPANIYVCVFAVTGELNPVIFPVRKLPPATAAAAALGAIQYVKIIVFHVLDRTAVSVSPQICEAIEEKADMQSDIYMLPVSVSRRQQPRYTHKVQRF